MRRLADQESFVFIGDLHLTDAEPPERIRKRYKDAALFPDRDFESLVERLTRDGRGATLVVLGDLIDFDLVEVSGGADWRAGARAKLTRVAADHPVFFRSLGRLLAAGHRVVLILGNHDLEFHDPSVREAFFEQVEAAARSECPDLAGAHLADRFTFEPWRLAEPGVFHAEHGQRLDPYSAVPDLLSPFTDGRRERLFHPLGSLVNRHIVNRLHTFDPLSSGALRLPATTYLWHLVWRYRPFYLPYHFLTGAVRTFLESMRQRREWLASHAGRERQVEGQALAGLGAQPLALTSLLRVARVLWLDRIALVLAATALLAGIAAATRSAGWTAAGALACATIGLLYSRRIGEREVAGFEDRIEAAVPALGRETAVPIVILGHTHRSADEVLGGIRYLNPGSWAASTDPAPRPRRAIRLARRGERVAVAWWDGPTFVCPGESGCVSSAGPVKPDASRDS